MFLVPAAFTFALLGGFAPQLKVSQQNAGEPHPIATRMCNAPTQTGTFRITATTSDSTNSKIGLILLENVDGCLEASMITDESGPAIIDHVAVADDVLTGSIRMATGTAKISFHILPNGIAGSIVAGRSEWKLTGRRTS